MAKFKIRTGVPKGRNTWEPDLNAKVQANLFSTVAMIVAANSDAEMQLMNAISDAKTKIGKLVIPA